MKEYFIDCIMDTFKMLPFLFIAFLIIELIEHKFSDKSKELIEKSGKYGPLFGGILGAFPQCGFSVLATHLYVTRIITLGTLIAVYLSTSDEMIPVLLSNNVSLSIVIKIIILKIIVGIVFGFIIDYILRYRKSRDYQICFEDTCHCEKSLLLSVVLHTLKTFIFILAFNLLISFGILVLNLDASITFLKEHAVLAPMLSSLVGLIPNCASSIFITQLYVNDIISFGTTMAGLLTGSGLAILLLLRNNYDYKENLLIISLVYLIGVLVGLAINVLSVL